MNVTILGAGKVGRGLSRGLASTPHRVQLIALGRGVRAPIRDALLVLAVRDGDLQRVAPVILGAATGAERAEVYASLGLRLDYDPHLRRVTATADLSRVAGCVRGGT